jgi:hypothetical protein
MTLRQIERKYIELQEAIRNNDGVQCASVPEVFFPEVCDDCPVRLRCFDYALSAGMQGIWGGTTHEERVKLRTSS